MWYCTFCSEALKSINQIDLIENVFSGFFPNHICTTVIDIQYVFTAEKRKTIVYFVLYCELYKHRLFTCTHRRSTSESEIIYFKKIEDKSLIFFSKQKQCGWGWRMGPRVPDWLGGVYDRNGPHYSFTATDLLYRGQATSQKYICHRRKYLYKTFSKLQY